MSFAESCRLIKVCSGMADYRSLQKQYSISDMIKSSSRLFTVSRDLCVKVRTLRACGKNKVVNAVLKRIVSPVTFLQYKHCVPVRPRTRSDANQVHGLMAGAAVLNSDPVHSALPS